MLKFLQQAEDDIAVTKYLFTMYLEQSNANDKRASQYLDTTVTKFLNQVEDEIAVTKYLGTSSTRFLDQANEDRAVARYLNGPEGFDENDISVTKFLNQAADDISVTKFLNQAADDISVTKFLKG